MLQGFDRKRKEKGNIDYVTVIIEYNKLMGGVKTGMLAGI